METIELQRARLRLAYLQRALTRLTGAGDGVSAQELDAAQYAVDDQALVVQSLEPKAKSRARRRDEL